MRRVLIVTGAGWEQTEATVEIGIPRAEGGESREDLVAGPVQVLPDEQGTSRHHAQVQDPTA